MKHAEAVEHFEISVKKCRIHVLDIKYASLNSQYAS
jgi:hypothetical protein